MTEEELVLFLKKWERQWKTIIGLVWLVIGLAVGLGYFLLLTFLGVK